MLQQYQQQPDYTPYGTGIGYGAQPNAGYFNYAASESSWYGSPSPADLHSGLSQNACNTHVGDSAGNFLNHGYDQTTTTGPASSSTAESFTANSHPVSRADMDPMVDFLSGHQNINENNKIKDESIDWLSTIINEEVVDHGNRQDSSRGTCDGGGGDGKILTGGADLPCKNHEPNGRLPNFHQAFGSTEIGRFSQHEYYEPPKDGEGLQSGGRGPPGVSGMQGAAGTVQQDEQPSAAAFEPPRQQNRRGRTPRGGGQHRRTKQTRTAAVAAAAVHQYVNSYDVTGSATVGGGGSRHQMPPYHHQDPYNRNQHAQQRYHHQQEYHGHHHQPLQTPSSYQNHHHEQYYRPYDRMHYQQQQQQQQQQQPGPPPMNQYYGGNRGEQSTYTAGGYNRFHSCCSTEHIARPSHHQNYGPGQYYGDYNAYSQW